MSFWRGDASSGTSIDPSSIASHPPKTEPVKLVNEGEQRSRLLNVYTYTLEQLLQEQEQRDVQREKKGAKEKDENCKKFSADDTDDGGCVRRYFTRCIQKCNETLAPYKLLYVFIRGGEACLTMYISFYALQVGVNPIQLAFIYALPRFISSLSTPLCGYIADKFRCRKEMLLFALCLWVFFSLAVNFIPAPKLTSCRLARTQFQDAIAKLNYTQNTRTSPMAVMMPSSSSSSSSSSMKVHPHVATGLVRNYDASDAKCMISDNVTAVSSNPSWLSILHIVNTPWTEKTEECYPGGRFWGANHVPGGVDVDGPSSTYAGWIFERDSLSSSFFAIFALITVAHVMQGPTLSLTDTSTLQTLGPNRSHEYGWQVAFGKASFAIYIILITIIIDMASSTWSRCEIEIHVEDYRIAFVVFFGTTSCAIGLLFAYCINMKFDNPNESNVYNLKKIFCRINNAALLPIMCYLAANEGAISVFLPFHLTNLGSPSLLVKSARIVSGVSELFLAFHLGQLIQSRGHIVLLSCGAIGYLLCFLAYALITTPFGILPVQVIQGVSHALTWNVLVARLSGEVNPENLATLQGCLSGIYLCGLGLGAVVAGVGVSHVGAPITFFCFAFACLVMGILMGIGSMSSNERTTRTKTIRYNPLPESDESDTG